jgi:hypothetical protein
MTSIYEIKQREVTDTPVLLFECQLSNGAVERWSTHQIQIGGNTYKARVLRHNLFDIRSMSDDGVDGLSKVSITLANADSYFSQIERAIGMKGGKIKVSFLFVDLKTGLATSDQRVVFRGLSNPPDEIGESAVRLTFVSRLSLQRTLLPEVRIQRRCPWVFPSNEQQRIEGAHGGTKGKYSPFFRCGYSPDVLDGTGTMNGLVPFTSCDYTRTQCEERGMFSIDATSRITRHFGGIEFVPSSILVKTYGEKSQHLSSAVANEAKYNDFVPMVYGTAWYRPPVVFARNDGNLTHLEVLLGMGEISGVLKVIANSVEIPIGQSGRNMTATGWYNVVSLGNRTGTFNGDFAQSTGAPAGDPYGSMGVLSVVLPNRLSDGSSLPRVEVLLEGIKLSTYDLDGEALGDTFTNNPSWVLLDVLRRCGWEVDEIDLASFARTAAYCQESIPTQDLYGNDKMVSRFQCNLVLSKRRSAADLIRGVRNGSGLYLTYGLDGLLQVNGENAIGLQHVTKPAGSNSEDTLNGGWPAYEFGDGSNAFSDILRKDNGAASVRLWSRSTADTPNRFTTEFQDEFNEYQQDSLSLVDFDDAIAAGQEVSASLSALGLPNFNQAGRIIRLQLDKAIRGNTYIEFETGIRAIGLRAGDLITVTYAKEGLDRQMFRVVRISPGLNYRTSLVTAQIHDDAWYVGNGDGDLGVIGGGRQPGYDLGLPRPLVGSTVDANGDSQFGVAEQEQQSSDGSYNVSVEVSFSSPGVPVVGGPGIPLLSLAATVATTGGALNASSTYYYAVSAVDVNGAESQVSFVIRATTPSGANTCAVTLRELSFSPSTTAFHVYRGTNPTQLLRITSDEALSPTFIDPGNTPTLEAPVDRNFHHANFYWRMELQPELPVTTHGTNTIGNATLHMLTHEFHGKIVRITQGKGLRQERLVLTNTDTTLTINSNWDVEPDSTSVFVVSEAGWQFGGLGQTSPVVFEVPNREHATIQISGRAANVHDRESAYELSPLTRYEIGGAGTGGGDAEVAGTPIFGLSSTGQGIVEVAGVGFENLANTNTITAASLTLHYFDELSGPPSTALTSGIDDSATIVDLVPATAAQAGDLVQVGSEVMVVTEVQDGGLRCLVERGAYGSIASAHAPSVLLYTLQKKVFVMPFVKNFFGSQASGSYSNPISLPDARIAAAAMYVTNSRGNSATAFTSYTATVQAGIRTLSGGQLSLQIPGFLAIQTDAVPALTIDNTHSVRDIFAKVGTAPTVFDVELRVKVSSVTYCNLTIAMGQTTSNIVDGFGLPPLAAGAQLGLDVVSVGQTNDSTPGSDLTVTVRL